MLGSPDVKGDFVDFFWQQTIDDRDPVIRVQDVTTSCS